MNVITDSECIQILHTYIHTYIYTYIHAYIYAYIMNANLVTYHALGNVA